MGPFFPLDPAITINYTDGNDDANLGSLSNQSSQLNIFTHTFTQAGTYVVSAEVEDSNDISNLANNIATLTITVIEPTYDFSMEDINMIATRTGSYGFEEYELSYQGDLSTIANITLSQLYSSDDEINAYTEFRGLSNTYNLLPLTDINFIDGFVGTYRFALANGNYPAGTFLGALSIEYLQNDQTTNTKLIPITLTIINQAPEITQISAPTYIIENEVFSAQVTANDPEGDALTYSLVNAPAGMTISTVGNNGYISWTSTTPQTTTVTVRVQDEYGAYDTQAFTIQVLVDAPQINIVQEELFFDGERGETLTETFTVRNNGAYTLTNIQIVTNTVSSEYESSITPINIANLAVGQSQTVTMSVYLPEDMDIGSYNIGIVGVQALGDAQFVSDSVIIRAQASTNLEITEVELRVEGEDDYTEDISEGESFEVYEDDSVRLRVTVENVFSDDVTIEDVEVHITDSEWGLDETSVKEDIDAGDDYTFTIEFDIEEYDELENTITIRVEGEDEDGVEHFAEFEFDLELILVDDRIEIISYDVSKNIISCDDNYFTVDVTVKNTGLDDQDEVIVAFESEDYFLNDFDQAYESSEFVLDQGDQRTHRFTVYVTDSMISGTKYFDLVAYYDEDIVSDRKIVIPVEFIGCNDDSASQEDEEEEEAEEEVIVVEPSFPSNPTTSQGGIIGAYVQGIITRTDANSSHKGFVIAGAILALVIVAGAIALFVVKRK